MPFQVMVFKRFEMLWYILNLYKQKQDEHELGNGNEFLCRCILSRFT